jgi:hypothetical protein
MPKVSPTYLMYSNAPSTPHMPSNLPRAGLKLARRVLWGGAQLVGGEPVEQVVFAVQHPHVRPEEFVL